MYCAMVIDYVRIYIYIHMYLYAHKLCIQSGGRRLDKAAQVNVTCNCSAAAPKMLRAVLDQKCERF